MAGTSCGSLPVQAGSIVLPGIELERPDPNRDPNIGGGAHYAILIIRSPQDSIVNC